MYFSPLSIVALIAAVGYLYFAFFIIWVKPRSEPNHIFSALSLSFCIWAVAYAFRINAANIDDAWFWFHLESIGWLMGPPLLFSFFYAIVGEGRPKRLKSVLGILTGFSTVLFLIGLNVDLVAVDFVMTPYGWDDMLDPGNFWMWIYLVYFSTLAISGLFLVYRWGKRSRHPQNKKQARIIFGFGFPTLALITFTNVAAKFLDLHYFPAPACILLIIWDFGILYAVVKYDFMRLDPSGAAEQILHTMEDALLLVSPRLNILAANKASEHLSGLSVEKLLSTNIGEVFPGLELFKGSALIDRVTVAAIRLEEVNVVRNEDTIPILLSATAVQNESGKLTGIVLIMRDESRSKALEFQLLHAMKMEAVGQLAGGLAHDFNNLLVAIMSHSELLQMDNPEESPNHESGQIIESAARRAIELTDQLLGFARRGKHQIVEVELHQTIQEAIKLLSRTIDKRIKLTMNLHAERDEILGDPGQMQQVLLNLAINARDAMQDVGQMTIDTENIDLDREECAKYSDLKPGQHIRLSFTDTGGGIEEKNIRRIFEPFFTTKKPGSGTGMGLAMVYGIVKNHGGDISVTSEAGKGTTFSVLIPVNQDGSRDSVHDNQAILHNGVGSILLIDDEEMVCRVTTEILEKMGFNIVSFTSPTKGIAHYQNNWRKVDLVVLDLIMPELEGPEVFKALQHINPKVKVVLCSGYSLDGKAQEALDSGALCFLKKPFSLEELSDTIRDSLPDTNPRSSSYPPES